MARKSRFSKSHAEDQINLRLVIDALVSSVNEAKQTIKFFAGEAYWIVFDHPKCVRAFENGKKASKEILLVVGPVLSKGRGESSPMLVDLAERGVVRLFVRPTRTTGPHFRIIDDKVVISHKSHAPLRPLYLRPRGVRINIDEKPDIVKQYIKTFKEFANDDFESKNPRRDFLSLFPEDILDSYSLAIEEKKPYDDLNRAQIEDLLAKITQRRKESEELIGKSLECNRNETE